MQMEDERDEEQPEVKAAASKDVAPGDYIRIVLRDMVLDAKVENISPQIDLHSEEAPAVIVKIDGNLNTFAHKSRTGLPPYWESAE